MKKGLVYRGDSEQDRIDAAIMYDRLDNLIQRFGQSITQSERDAFIFCASVLIVPPVQDEDYEEPEPQPAARVETPRAAEPPEQRPARKLRQV